jgi:formylglycine-generating enzyme required for sulfatase activity
MARYALLIGTDTYDDASFTDLLVPGKDIDALHSVLTATKIGAFPTANTQVLLNHSQAEVRKAVGAFFKGKRKDDLLLFYFSGHGELDEDGDLYLALGGTEKANLMGTALEASMVENAFRKCSATRQIIILDCCYSGAMAAGGKSAVDAKELDRWKGHGREILTSSSATQKSWESRSQGLQSENSLFTHFLVEGLQTGKAANSETITVEQLFNYASTRVKQQTGRMTPERRVENQRENIVIARNPNPPIKLPKDLLAGLTDANYLARERAVQILDEQYIKPNDPKIAPKVLKLLGDRLTGENMESDFRVRSAIEAVLAASKQPQQSAPTVDVPEEVEPTSPTSKPATETERKQRAEPTTEARHQAEAEQKWQEAQREATDEKVSRAHEKSTREAEEKEQLAALKATRSLEQETATREREIAAKALEEQQRHADTDSEQASIKLSKSPGSPIRNIFIAIFLIAMVPGLYLWDQQQSENEKELIYQRTLAAEQEKKRLAELAAEKEEQRLAAAQKKPMSTFTDNLSSGGKAPVMVVIPPGSFEMGSSAKEKGRDSDEGPQHKVRIKSFALGKYEITFAEYDLFVAATGRKKPSDEGWGRGQQPVINVSWNDATAYAGWLSDQTGKIYRLPTEAEWEYAARSGNMEPWFWGDNESAAAEFAWFGGNSKNTTHPLGEKKPNDFGLHDMAGNVWEWTEDIRHDDYKGAPTDGSPWLTSGDKSKRVLRGGSWNNEPRSLRSADRLRYTPVNRNYDVGFRLARTF